MGAPRRDGRKIDDRPDRAILVPVFLGLFDHPLGDRLAEPERGIHVLLHQHLDGVVRSIQRIAFLDLPGGVDQDIDPVESVDGGRDQVGHGQFLAQVAREEPGLAALILDIAGLGARAQLMSDDELQRTARLRGGGGSRPVVDEEEPVEYLVASVGGDRRVAMELSQVDRLEEIESATVEKAGTLRFIQYRGDLLQLIDVGQAMGTASSTDPSRRIWKTIVRTKGGSSYGLSLIHI